MIAYKIVKEDLPIYLKHMGIEKKENDVNYIDYLKVIYKFPVFKLVKCKRLCEKLSKNKILKPIFYYYRLKYRQLQIKFGVQIGYTLQAKKGFFIGHYSGIVIHSDCKIGENFIIHQNTSIGTTDNGVPIIGNNVTLGTNVVIIGNVVIGNNVTIGAGTVVTKDIPDNAIVVGNPAHIIGYNNKGERNF